MNFRKIRARLIYNVLMALMFVSGDLFRLRKKSMNDLKQLIFEHYAFLLKHFGFVITSIQKQMGRPIIIVENENISITFVKDREIEVLYTNKLFHDHKSYTVYTFREFIEGKIDLSEMNEIQQARYMEVNFSKVLNLLNDSNTENTIQLLDNLGRKRNEAFWESLKHKQ